MKSRIGETFKDRPALPVLMVSGYAEEDGIDPSLARRLYLFAVIATFETAQHVTADELRIDSLFPADAATEALFRQAAAVRRDARPAADQGGRANLL